MDKGKNQTLVAKIVCVLLSFGLWLYISNVENPTRTYEVKNVPVQLVNLDILKESNLSVVSNQVFTVDLKLEGPSIEVVKVRKNDFKVIADMSTYALKEGENTIPVKILTYPENVNIKNNGFVGIKVMLEKYITKEVNITSNVALSYKDNVYGKSQSISPKTVSVSGGESQVNRISKAVLNGQEKDISSNISKKYNINFLDELGNEVSEIEPSSYTAKLDVKVANGKSVPISLRTSGDLPKGYVLESSSLSNTNVNISGEDSLLETINNIYTEYVDISKLTSDSKIEVKLNIPQGINLESSENTVTVSFVIKKETMIDKEVSCNVEYLNIPDGFLVENSTQEVKVTLSGLKSDIENINADNIKVTMDLSKINKEGTYTYTPEVKISIPNNITITGVENVDLTIKKKTE